MAIRTFGTMAVDWEQRVDFERLRTQRLARLKAQLERSDLGALLSFDMSNTRYMTATHIGTWAMDKLIRFALLPRGGEDRRSRRRLHAARRVPPRLRDRAGTRADDRRRTARARPSRRAHRHRRRRDHAAHPGLLDGRRRLRRAV